MPAVANDRLILEIRRNECVLSAMLSVLYIMKPDPRVNAPLNKRLISFLLLSCNWNIINKK